MSARTIPPRVVPMTLFQEYERLLADYRRVLEQLDGKATDRIDDESLLRMAAALYMRGVIADAKAMGGPLRVTRMEIRVGQASGSASSLAASLAAEIGARRRETL